MALSTPKRIAAYSTLSSGQSTLRQNSGPSSACTMTIGSVVVGPGQQLVHDRLDVRVGERHVAAVQVLLLLALRFSSVMTEPSAWNTYGSCGSRTCANTNFGPGAVASRWSCRNANSVPSRWRSRNVVSGVCRRATCSIAGTIVVSRNTDSNSLVVSKLRFSSAIGIDAVG